MTAASRVNIGSSRFVRSGKVISNGLKIPHPASCLVRRNDTKQYLPTFQPSKQLTSCLVSLGDPRIFHASLDQRKEMIL
jgi:hypothetical protein